MQFKVLTVSAVIAALAMPGYMLAGPAPMGLPLLGVEHLANMDKGELWLSRCRNSGDGDRPRAAPPPSSQEDEGETGGDETQAFLLLEAQPIPVRFSGDCDDFGPNTGGLSTRTTKVFVDVLNEANETCASGAAAAGYQIDCLRAYYARIVAQLPDTGDYAPIKQALQQAERKLDQIVRENLDTSAPMITPNRGNKPDAPRTAPLRKVKKSAEKKALAQAEEVLKEAELLIVRSGGDPARRTPHYNEIAGAVEDNLLILRSA